MLHPDDITRRPLPRIRITRLGLFGALYLAFTLGMLAALALVRAGVGA